MSFLRAIKAQLGLSNTPANNFTITAEADNGTLKLARGNAGATTQDILTVDASGNVLVDGNNLNLFSANSLASAGYQKLPSGLIIQWAQGATSTAGEVSEVVTLPITFPNSNLFSSVSSLNATAAQSADTNYHVVSKTTSQVTVFRQQNPPNSGALAPLVFAIGY